MTPPSLILTIVTRPPVVQSLPAHARFLAAVVAAAALHAGIALVWLGSAVTPLGSEGSRLDAVAVILVDGQALESLKPVSLPAPAAQDRALAPMPGDAIEARATTQMAPTELEVVEPPPPTDDPAVTIAAVLPIPHLPLEPPTIEPLQPSLTAASTRGGATARTEAVAPPADATVGAPPGVVEAYRSSLAAALSKTQPPNRGTAGTVRVAFTVGQDGALDAVSVSASSGHAKLDSLAVAAVRRARLPAPHVAMTSSQRTFSMRYVFK